MYIVYLVVITFKRATKHSKKMANKPENIKRFLEFFFYGSTGGKTLELFLSPLLQFYLLPVQFLSPL